MTHHPAAPTVEVWLATPEAIPTFDPAALTEPERAEWTALHTSHRRRDWAAGRSLLRAVPDHSNRAWSLSHSNGYAAVALAPRSVSIGVDVEWLAPREFSGMAEIGFSPAEAAFIASIDEPRQRGAAFYELWTLKEAAAKAFGMHFLAALRDCRFVDAGGAWQVDLPTAKNWRAVVYAPRPDLRLAVIWAADTCDLLIADAESKEWPLPALGQWRTVHQFSSLRGADGC